MLILASASPRRREILTMLGVEFILRPAEVDERIPPGTPPDEAVCALALKKAQAVRGTEPIAPRPTNRPSTNIDTAQLSTCRDGVASESNDIILAADTVVALDGDILGKPSSREEAAHMLRRLSGRTHEVFTGVALRQGEHSEGFHSRAEVTFYPLTPKEIEDYLDTGEPFDKAGAYGINGPGCVLIKSITGDYYTVMGLPAAMVYRRLKAWGVI